MIDTTIEQTMALHDENQRLKQQVEAYQRAIDVYLDLPRNTPDALAEEIQAQRQIQAEDDAALALATATIKRLTAERTLFEQAVQDMTRWLPHWKPAAYIHRRIEALHNDLAALHANESTEES